MSKRNETRIGMWKKVSRSGNGYLGGSDEHFWINYFKNKNKQSDTASHGTIMFYPKEEFKGRLLELKVYVYKRKSRKGEEYLSGEYGGKWYSILPNKFKKTTESPDYNLLITEAKDASVTKSEGYSGHDTNREQSLVDNAERAVNIEEAEEEADGSIYPDGTIVIDDDEEDDDDIPF